MSELTKFAVGDRRRVGQPLLRFLEQLDGRIVVGFDFAHWPAGFDSVAVAHHCRFRARAQIAVAVVEAGFDQLEPLQIRCDPELIRLFSLTGTVGFETAVQASRC